MNYKNQMNFRFKLKNIAFRFALKIVDTPPFISQGASVELPKFKSCKSNYMNQSEYLEYINCIVRTAAISSYHPIGTSKMGRKEDPNAVIDAELK